MAWRWKGLIRDEHDWFHYFNRIHRHLLRYWHHIGLKMVLKYSCMRDNGLLRSELQVGSVALVCISYLNCVTDGISCFQVWCTTARICIHRYHLDLSHVVRCLAQCSIWKVRKWGSVTTFCSTFSQDQLLLKRWSRVFIAGLDWNGRLLQWARM